MDPATSMWIVAAVVVLAIFGLAVWFWQRNRSLGLRQRFGPEYDRRVEETGDRRRAESELAERAKRVEHLDIRPLSPEDTRRFTESWQDLQTRFVDDPSASIAGADDLVTEVMRVRGYPMADFEQRAADISVDHPQVVVNYRTANDIARRRERGEATTEDLRQAMVHYRALFRDLLETETPEEVPSDERAARRAA